MNSLKLFIVLSYIFFTFRLEAQVLNGGFEQWASGEPVGWSTNNILVPAITQSSDAHSGTSAARGDVLNNGSTNQQPLLVSGLIFGHGFPVSERHSALIGYYKLNAITVENLSITVELYKEGENIGFGGTQFFAADNYTQLTIPIFYSNESTPDSCKISMTIGNNSGNVEVGAYFIIDDLAFQGITTSIGDNDNLNPYTFSLEQNYPNPFNPSTKIKFTVPTTPLNPSPSQGEGNSERSIILKIYDILGNEITTLVNEQKSPGTYEIEFDRNGLSSGVYYYKLQAGDFTDTKKMILLK